MREAVVPPRVGPPALADVVAVDLGLGVEPREDAERVRAREELARRLCQKQNVQDTFNMVNGPRMSRNDLVLSEIRAAS